MSRTMKAVLLSGFVFPGLGQIYLKKYRRGLVLMAMVLLGFIAVVGMATVGALKSIEEIQTKGDLVTADTIIKVAQTHAEGMTGYFRAIIFLMIGCWVFSIIDAYRAGKMEEFLEKRKA